MRSVLAVLLALVLAGPTLGQAPTRRVEVRVTSVTDGQVYLDGGRDRLLEPGDEVRLFPLGRSEVRAVVRSVSKHGARAELKGSAEGIEIGILGEASIPTERGSPPTDAEEAKPPAGESVLDVPEHPPWQQEQVWDPNTPLLAPIRSPEPEERPATWRGRFFTSFDLSEDSANGSRTYQSARAGLDVHGQNLFGHAGDLHVDIEGFQREVDITGEPKEDDSRLRIDRLSYTWGGLRGRPNQFGIGRFLHSEFSEFGVVDGGEWVRRTKSGDRFGVSLGFLPEPTDEFMSGDDLQGAVFYRHVSGEDERTSMGVGYQKTWHDGDADRDLMVGSFDHRFSERTTVSGTAWLDYYGSDAVLKSQGFELTQLNLNANHRFDSGAGVGAFVTELRQPELLRNEFGELPPETIADYHLTRVGLNGWVNVSKQVRLSSRAYQWTDEDTSDVGGEIRVGLRDMLYEDGEVALTLFDTGGKFSSGVGLRATASKRFDRSSANLTYELTDFEQADFTGDLSSLAQHVIRGSYETSFGKDWSVSVDAQSLLGDEQDSYSLGFRVTRRIR